MSDYITRNEHTEHLPGMPNPIPGHEPMWTSVDCPAGGDYPCGEQHPDLLICKDDEEDYPCHVVQQVAAELERMAAEYVARARNATWHASSAGYTAEQAAAFGARAKECEVFTVVLRNRAAGLRGEQS